MLVISAATTRPCPGASVNAAIGRRATNQSGWKPLVAWIPSVLNDPERTTCDTTSK